MLDAVLGQLTVAGIILFAGIGLFLTVNKKRATEVEGVDPATGERTIVTRWIRGTRRSRWRGYCTIGGAVLGSQIPGLLHLLSHGADGLGPPAGMVVMETAPVGMLCGLLVGLTLGAISSQFISESTQPLDPDNQ